MIWLFRRTETHPGENLPERLGSSLKPVFFSAMIHIGLRPGRNADLRFIRPTPLSGHLPHIKTGKQCKALMLNSCCLRTI